MILIVGSTGYLGSAVTRKLLKAGKPVRIVARPGSAYEPLAALGAEVVFGDLNEPASLLAATRGVAAVVSTANSALRGGLDTAVDLNGNQALIDAAVANKVGHFTFVTGLATSVDSPIPYMPAKAKTEASLKARGLTYTIVACQRWQASRCASWVRGAASTPLSPSQTSLSSSRAASTPPPPGTRSSRLGARGPFRFAMSSRPTRRRSAAAADLVARARADRTGVARPPV